MAGAAASAWSQPLRCARRAARTVAAGLWRKDRLVREADVGGVHRRYRRYFPDCVTDLEVFPDRDHALTFDRRWLNVAFYCLDWLTAHDL